MDAAPAFSEIIWRIIAATLAGALIGMERETHGRPAGLRTTILTCVASALAMILSEALFYHSAQGLSGGNWRPDPARLGAGILTGIGFLGAGTILRHEKIILGVTTAASLWFVTVLGLAFGSGLFLPGAIGLGIALIALVLLPKVEKFIPSDWYATLTITLELEALTEQELKRRLKALGLKVKRMDLNYDLTARQKIISCELKLKRRSLLEMSTKTMADLRQCPGVLQIKWT
jgi:putative Mg2+ transporter-C (MgtC) family protein